LVFTLHKIVFCKKNAFVESFKIQLNGKNIDVYSAAKQLEKQYKPRYDPERTGIYGLFVRVNGITYCVYCNGSLCVYGKKPTKQKINNFQEFWQKKLRFFLV